MASRIDPSVRVFAMDTGRLPQETYDLIETIRERYGLRGRGPLTGGPAGPAARRRHGPNLFYQSVDLRLLCCKVRKVQPLNRYSPALDAWVTGVRRDQWAAARTSARSRSTTTTAVSEAQPAGRVDGRRGLGLRPRERRARPPAVRSGLHVDRLRAVHTSGRRRVRTNAPAAGGGRRTRRRSAACTARSRRAASSTSCTRSSARTRIPTLVAVKARSARSRSARCRPCSRPRATRTTVRRLVAAGRRGRGEASSPRSRRAELERMLELGLQAGRIRAVYGRGRASCAPPLPAASRRRWARRDRARVSAALTTLNGRSLESFRIEVVGPGMYRIALVAGGAEVARRFDRSGVQLASIGV